VSSVRNVRASETAASTGQTFGLLGRQDAEAEEGLGEVGGAHRNCYFFSISGFGSQTTRKPKIKLRASGGAMSRRAEVQFPATWL
jgi:hypothetical protein